MSRVKTKQSVCVFKATGEGLSRYEMSFDKAKRAKNSVLSFNNRTVTAGLFGHTIENASDIAQCIKNGICIWSIGKEDAIVISGIDGALDKIPSIQFNDRSLTPTLGTINQLIEKIFSTDYLVLTGDPLLKHVHVVKAHQSKSMLYVALLAVTQGITIGIKTASGGMEYATAAL